jgi:hypothetical protein
VPLQHDANGLPYRGVQRPPFRLLES